MEVETANPPWRKNQLAQFGHRNRLWGPQFVSNRGMPDRGKPIRGSGQFRARARSQSILVCVPGGLANRSPDRRALRADSACEDGYRPALQRSPGPDIGFRSDWTLGTCENPGTTFSKRRVNIAMAASPLEQAITRRAHSRGNTPARLAACCPAGTAPWPGRAPGLTPFRYPLPPD